jgi:copper transport protein
MIKSLCHFLFMFVVSIIFLSLILSFNNIVKISYGQSTPFETESETDITSYLDALIKAPLLVSQAFVVGVSFVHSILFIRIIKKEPIFFNNNDSVNTSFLLALFNNKLFVIIIIVCGVVILNMSTISVLYQASLLSLDLGLDLWSTFIILFSSSVGNIFIIKLLTSSFIIALATLYYYYIRKRLTKIFKLKQDEKEKEQQQQQQNLTIKKLTLIKTSLTFCISILILGSINIFSNSIQSHNAAVDFFPYIAISVDWLHFMMVSIWVGGLFYISLILSRNLFVKERLSHHQSSIKNVKDSIDVPFFLSTILRFSIVAIISLGIIFITGLYMGVLHLQQPSSFFNSTYGNILILKLIVVFSMALLGGYHHFRIPLLINKKKMEERHINQLQIFKGFNKSLKIEYVLGISIIFISSFLTITSPPQHESHSMDMSITMNTPVDSNTQKMTNSHSPNFDKTFSLIALILSISIAILVILFVRRGWISLKLYTQRK